MSKKCSTAQRFIRAEVTAYWIGTLAGLFQPTRLFGTLGIDAAKLIAASVMAAPAALAVSKLFYPETEKTKTSIDEIKLEEGSEANILDAAAQGASSAIMLVLNIGASLIAFLAFVECINHIIGNFCSRYSSTNLLIYEKRTNSWKWFGYPGWKYIWHENTLPVKRKIVQLWNLEFVNQFNSHNVRNKSYSFKFLIQDGWVNWVALTLEWTTMEINFK